MILHIRAVEACDVPKMDIFSKSDPYLKFKISTSSQIWKTRVRKNTHEPVCNDEFHLPITSGISDKLYIELFDKDTISKDDIISTQEFEVKSFPEGEIIDQWYDFLPAKGVKKGGRVRLVFHLTKSGDEAFITI